MVHFAGECRCAHVGLAPRLDLADMESVRQVAAWFISQVSVGGNYNASLGHKARPACAHIGIEQALEVGPQNSRLRPPWLTHYAVGNSFEPAAISCGAKVTRLATLHSQGQPLDLLVNNAGANFFPTPSFTETGVGLCAQINFLSPYLLTRLLVHSPTRAVPSLCVLGLSLVLQQVSISHVEVVSACG